MDEDGNATPNLMDREKKKKDKKKKKSKDDKNGDGTPNEQTDQEQINETDAENQSKKMEEGGEISSGKHKRKKSKHRSKLQCSIGSNGNTGNCNI